MTEEIASEAPIKSTTRKASAKIKPKAIEPENPEQDVAVDQPDVVQLAAEKATELPSEIEIENLIKTYVVAAMGVALVPVPMFDAAAIIAVQLKMVHGFAKLYDVPFNEKLARRIIISLIGGAAPVAIALGAASLAKSVPLAGTLAGTAGMVVLAGAITYAIGKVFARHFDSGGDLMGFSVAEMRAFFLREFKLGKSVAKDLKADSATAETAKPEPA
ncbi:MAG: DUF697 domain-containing protein [Rhodobacteraceae bacterium]|nr:DUF697 domain-containing protein [Paracoccaceae bacterium]